MLSGRRCVLPMVSRIAIATAARRSMSVAIRAQRPVLAALYQTAATTAATPFCSNSVRCFSASGEIIPGIGKGKTSTGIVGLDVEPDWYNLMLKHFGALLDKMEESDMPETCSYRIAVTKWCNHVIKVTKANPEDSDAVEDAVRMGQVEELIDMAKDEMIAMETYLETRMWELVDQSNKAVVFNPDPMEDPAGEGGDPEVAEALKQGMEEPEEKEKK